MGYFSGKNLGENQTGGTIIVLGIGYENKFPVGEDCAKGIKGGKIYIRTKKMPKASDDIKVRKATNKDKESIKLYIEEYCAKFNMDAKKLIDSTYYVIEASEANTKKIRM